MKLRGQLAPDAKGSITIRYPIRIVRITSGFFNTRKVLIEDGFGNTQWLAAQDIWAMNITVDLENVRIRT